MAAMAADPETQRWWKLTDAMQDPLPDREPGYVVEDPPRGVPHRLTPAQAGAAETTWVSLARRWA